MKVPDEMVAKILPQVAVNRLRAAAEVEPYAKRRPVVDAAIRDVKLMYPQFFKEQEK
jgi:hypothetical protein